MTDSLTKAIITRFEGAQNRLVLQASDLSLATVAEMVESNAIDVRPEFQRRERWDNTKRSALIESFLLNIPVPPIYLAEDEYGSYSVIDGKQRLSAITEFLNDRLVLTSLQRFGELERYTFSALPRPLRNFLTVRPAIRAVSLLRQSDPELKYEVFHRLNAGGEPLNAQEIRNVLFRGPLNDLVVELGEHPFLRNQLKIRNERSPNYRKMLDAEYVLRYLTLTEVWQEFAGDLRYSMDQFMISHQHAEKTALSAFGRRFRNALEACETLWGGDAFKRPEGRYWRDFALAGMYDAQMVGVSEVGPRKLIPLSHLSDVVKDRTRLLFEDDQFEASVRTGTNTPSRLRYRVGRMITMLSDLF